MKAKHLIVAMAVVLTGIAVLWAVPRDQPKAEETVKLMREKMKLAQAALEAMAVEDFDTLAKSAQGLAMLAEKAEWNVLHDEPYQLYSREFRQAALALRGSAQQKQRDSATLNYMRMTMSCMDCHKYIRDARLDRDNPK